MAQFNMRVTESVASAYRSFCKERGLTQSEGLCLLLFSEEFTERNMMIQEYLEKLNRIKEENADLKQQNKELQELQKGKETWVLHQRKEWIKIAKEFLQYMDELYPVPPKACKQAVKPFSFKSVTGSTLFHQHQYPVEAGCYEVIIKGQVRGKSSGQTNCEEWSPIFICGVLQDQTPIKCRWYPRESFIGVSPVSELFPQPGDLCLLCCITTRDGAAELVGAMPIRKFRPCQSSWIDLEDLKQSSQDNKNRSSVDSLISAAEQKTQKNGFK